MRQCPSLFLRQSSTSLKNCPVLVFTHDTDADRMAQALDAGIHTLVVNGQAAQRLLAEHAAGDAAPQAAQLTAIEASTALITAS